MQANAHISWPSARLYTEAIQCPTVCFAQAELRDTIPAVDRLGMPLVTSGQFAFVYKLRSSHGLYAARCFRSHLGDRERRYQLIDEHLRAHPVPAFVQFAYDAQGILVSGRRYPLLVMEWLAGPTLDVYLDEIVGRRDVLLHLADEWLRLLTMLRAAGVAHGDLQHGNIIVEQGQLRLVDFDGLFVPAMTGWSASEVGHQHFQHPRRDARCFDARLDNFSGLVIYLSLIALAERPALWQEFHDENLLFTKEDFLAPERSRLLAQIKELGGEHRELAELLAAGAQGPPADVPSLLELKCAVPDAKLPAWLAAPADAYVISPTREAPQTGPPPAAMRAPVWIRRPTQPGSRMPSTPGSVAVQSVFSAPAPLVSPYAGDHPTSDLYGLGQNAIKHARMFARERKSFFWWYVGLYNLLYLLGMPFGTALLFTVMLLVGICLVYGVLRALREPQPTLLNSGAATATLPYTPGGPGRVAQWSLMSPTAIGALPQTVSNGAIVGNLTLAIYHMDNCEWAQKIPHKNRVAFASAATARTSGYRPCHICITASAP